MSNRAMGRKGAGEWSDIFLTVILSACILVLALKIPEVVKDIATLLTLASAEKTARDLGGLITISGAGQDSMVIIYESEDESISYDIEIKDRRVHIINIRRDGEIIKSGESTIATGWGKIAVGDISETLEDARVFTIRKTRVVSDGETSDIYDVS